MNSMNSRIYFIQRKYWKFKQLKKKLNAFYNEVKLLEAEILHRLETKPLL